jgi:hypothetical protein
MTEQETIEMGCYCQELMVDPRFSKLVSVCENQLALESLQGTTPEEREKTYYTYQGLKSLLELMQQFVIAKDQIVALREQEENKE